MDENKYWLSLWSIIVGGVVVLILVGSMICSWHNQSMADKGMCEQQRLGTEGTMWVKCK